MKLTTKQETFCQNIALEEMNQTQAYRNAYNTKNMKPETIHNNAYKLLQNSEVATRINKLKTDLQEKTINKIVYTREQSFKVFDDNIKSLKERLNEVLKDKEMSLKDKAYLENALRKNIKEQEEQKAKLWSLYVDKKEIAVKTYEQWLDELEE